MTLGEAVELLAGLALLGVAGLAWSGKWRRWTHSPWLRAAPITAVPGLGMMLVFAGLLGVLPPAPRNALGGVTVLLMLALLFLSAADPGWFGPRWYRRFKAAFGREGERGTFAWMAEDYRQPGESSPDATYRHQTSLRPQPPFNWVRLVSRPKERVHSGTHGDSGVFVYYPQSPVWAAGVGEDGVLINDILASETFQSVRKLSPGTGLDGLVRRSGLRSYLVPRVRIDTTLGTWLFESRKATDVVREVKRRYLDPSRDMYGFPLDAGARSVAQGDGDQSLDVQDRAGGNDGRESHG